MIKIRVNGKPVAIHDEDKTLLDVIKEIGINIPALCYHPGLPARGSCRLCVVEITKPSWNGRSKIVTSCLYPCEDGLEVLTHSPKVIKLRKVIIKLLLARCSDSKELQELALQYNADVSRFGTKENEKCILCGLCTRACEEMGIEAISMVNRGWKKEVAPPYYEPPENCIGCGACAEVCPVGAIELTETNGIRRIWNREFEIQKCVECGKYFATVAQLEHLHNKYGIPLKDLKTCPECSKKRVGTVLKKTFFD
ncbi:MAG: bidirectional [NiFe] hydrogenase diaphorase subunit [Thermosediminibacterales bacterium]|nr:bidirectional [NiFe] hydrogenase diaphorase subunit [Thermosediminibacterales bacterium]